MHIARGRKEMFYLTTHSSHFIYGYMALYIIIVKDHSFSERGNLPPLHGLLFPIISKGHFIYIIRRGTLAGTRNKEKCHA